MVRAVEEAQGVAGNPGSFSNSRLGGLFPSGALGRDARPIPFSSAKHFKTKAFP